MKLTVTKTKIKPTQDPIGKLMAQISKLEAELETVESNAPKLLNKMHVMLQPFALRYANAYADFIIWLGKEFQKPRASMSFREDVAELAEIIYERAQDNWNIDLTDTMTEAGFWNEQKNIDDDPDWHTSLSEQEADVFHGVMDGIFEQMGATPPDHIRAAMFAAYKRGEEPGPEVQEWFAQHDQPERVSSKQSKAKSSKKSSIPSLDPEQLKKKLYHGLARNLHPDKAAEAEKETRTALMQQLNQAYSKGDMSTLLKLLHVHGSDDMKAGIGPESTKFLKDALEQQKFRLKLQIRSHLEMLPNIGNDWLKVLGNTDAQALLVAQEELKTVKEEARFHTTVMQLQKPKQLAAFFKKYELGDWVFIF